MLLETYTPRQDTYCGDLAVQTTSQIEDAPPELVYPVLRPLYELFDFFPLPPTLVAEKLASTCCHRF